MAEKKFFVDINLQGSALVNAKLGTNTGIGSVEGAFGYDSASHRLQYFDGTATKNVANLTDIATVTGGLIFQGGYDPTTNTPDITDGAALKGFFWVATAAGTFLGEAVQVGDSIVAKVDNASTTLSDWLILQGNVVIATDSVDGISRLATQTEANDGTEAGAVVITPATLQGKIDAQVTPEINNKLPLAGGTMSGNINMGGSNSILDFSNLLGNNLSVNSIEGYDTQIVDINADLDFQNSKLPINLPAPTNGGDAANKTYVDDNTSNKLPLAGGTMSGDIDMGGHYIINATLSGNLNANGNKITNLYLDPTSDGDATSKYYVDGAASTAQANAEATASADATAKADDAQAAAEAYADSLAPNYDAAGAAASAESNANAYTDEAIAQEVTDRNAAIAAQSYSQTIEPADWQFNATPAFYYLDITHNLGVFINVSTFVKDAWGNYSPAEFSCDNNPTVAPNIYSIYSNIAPTSDVLINFNKAGGNL